MNLIQNIEKLGKNTILKNNKINLQKGVLKSSEKPKTVFDEILNTCNSTSVPKNKQNLN